MSNQSRIVTEADKTSIYWRELDTARRQDELNQSSEAFGELVVKIRADQKPELDAFSARVKAYQQTDEYKQYLATQTA